MTTEKKRRPGGRNYWFFRETIPMDDEPHPLDESHGLAPHGLGQTPLIPAPAPQSLAPPPQNPASQSPVDEKSDPLDDPDGSGGLEDYLSPADLRLLQRP